MRFFADFTLVVEGKSSLINSYTKERGGVELSRAKRVQYTRRLRTIIRTFMVRGFRIGTGHGGMGKQGGVLGDIEYMGTVMVHHWEVGVMDKVEALVKAFR